MKPAVVLLGLVLVLDTTFAAEESCVGRCGTFTPRSKCQCDSMCVYYGSCCEDFDNICPKKTARGDNFEETQDVTEAGTTADESTMSLPSTIAPTAFSSLAPPPNIPYGPMSNVDPDAEPCSGRPFDAFLQLKNGSIYAFRGVLSHFQLRSRSRPRALHGKVRAGGVEVNRKRASSAANYVVRTE